MPEQDVGHELWNLTACVPTCYLPAAGVGVCQTLLRGYTQDGLGWTLLPRRQLCLAAVGFRVSECSR